MMKELPPRLILVEGVPFTGKSTLSEFVATQLRLNGHPVQWVSEGVMLKQYFPHVLATFEQEEPLNEEVLWENWRDFVTVVGNSGETFVVDSALSNAALHTHMEANRPTDAILAWLARLSELCAPLQPRVIHLTGDVAHLVPASIADRGEGWRRQLLNQSDASAYQQARGRSGIEGIVPWMDESQALTSMVLAAGWHTYTLDVTAGDWERHQKEILDFLELDDVSVPELRLDPEMLQACTGSYLPEDPHDGLGPLTIQLDQDTLVLYGPDWRYGPLIPESDRRVHLRATPVDIEFTVDRGKVNHFVVISADGRKRPFHRDGSRSV